MIAAGDTGAGRRRQATYPGKRQTPLQRLRRGKHSQTRPRLEGRDSVARRLPTIAIYLSALTVTDPYSDRDRTLFAQAIGDHTLRYRGVKKVRVVAVEDLATWLTQADRQDG